MNNFWVTVGHTVKTRIQSKAFFWSTIIMMLLIIGLLNITNIIEVFSGDNETGESQQTVLVVDQSTNDSRVAEALENNNESTFDYQNYTEAGEESALEAARSGESDFVLTLQGNPVNLEAEFFGDENGSSVIGSVNQEVQRAKESLVTNQLGLSGEQLAMINAPVSFNEQPLTEGTEVATEEEQMQAYWMVYGLVFVIYLIVLSFGTMIATEVATEKSSRVMELIVSSVNPVVQMFGKLVGIGIFGLINLGTLVLAVIIGFMISGDNIIQNFFSGMIDMSLLFYALALIILGYFIYGGVAAMLGALVSRTEEVNQAIQPLVFLAMIALFISIFGLNAPDSAFVQVLSYIPFFTPQLLFLRIGMGTVPMWEVLLIFAILIVSALLINILAARIYKGGVLMYGKFSFKNGIKQALTMSKREK